MSIPKELERICHVHHVRTLQMFGSAARQQTRPDSDVDLIVIFEPHVPVGLLAVGALQMDLEDFFGRSVDLLTPAAIASTPWAKTAMQEARILYGS